MEQISFSLTNVFESSVKHAAMLKILRRACCLFPTMHGHSNDTMLRDKCSQLRAEDTD